MWYSLTQNPFVLDARFSGRYGVGLCLFSCCILLFTVVNCYVIILVFFCFFSGMWEFFLTILVLVLLFWYCVLLLPPCCFVVLISISLLLWMNWTYFYKLVWERIFNDLNFLVKSQKLLKHPNQLCTCNRYGYGISYMLFVSFRNEIVKRYLRASPLWITKIVWNIISYVWHTRNSWFERIYSNLMIKSSLWSYYRHVLNSLLNSW